jgi:hypothetical protein
MALFEWKNFSKLTVRPRASFFYNKSLEGVINNLPTGPSLPETTGPTDNTVIRCLGSIVSATVENDKYKFTAIPGIFGVYNGSYSIYIPPEHPIVILNKNKESLISIYGNNVVDKTTDIALDGNTGYNYYYGNCTLTVSGDFDKVSYACLYHGYEGGLDNLRYSQTCAIVSSGLSGPGGGSSGASGSSGNVYVPPTFINARFKQVDSSVFVCDNEGLIYQYNNQDVEIFSLPDSIENLSYPRYASGQESNVYYVVSGIYTTLASGQYKIQKLPANYYGSEVDASKYYTLVDNDGNIVLDPNYSASNNVGLVIFSNTAPTFPFTSYAKPAASIGTTYTNVEYNIVGYFVKNDGIYRLKQPILGTYEDSTWYLLVNSSGTEVLDEGTVTVGDKVSVTWNGTDSFPITRYSNSGYQGIEYSIVGVYTVDAAGTYKIRAGYLGEFESSTTYNLVSNSGVLVNDPGTGNTSTVTVTYTGTGPFPIKRSSNSGYSVIEYNITGFYTEDVSGSFRLKQKVVDNQPSSTYIITTTDGEEIEDPTLNDGTKATTTWNPETSTLPKKFASQQSPWLIYNAISVYSISKGPYLITPTSNQNEYTVIYYDKTAVLDEGLGNQSSVLITWTGSEPFPFYKKSNSNYSYINYYITDIYNQPNPPSPTGPTGPSSQASTGPANTASYSYGGLFSSPDYVGTLQPTGYTGPVFLDPSNVSTTQATGPSVTNKNLGKVMAVAAGAGAIVIDTDITNWDIFYQS